ncbi:MAG: serine/threonine protein kinase [Gammaproteobacteria bacterium]|nr:serine/threonine protein kinase [Gammaproteobacteria bacterium]
MSESSTDNIKTLPQGYRLAEYSIDSVLGKGAFGVTYQAHDNQLNRKVAIKEFFPAKSASRRDDGGVTVSEPKRAEFYRWGLDRFLTEAQVLAQFKHANIVRVNRFFSLNNTGYMVMDYEEGCTLGEIIQGEGPLTDEGRVRDLLDAVLAGLEEVHSKKYLHRDIKPGNVYMRDGRQPVLIDFGAARLDIGVEGHEKKLIFTPNYSPPEQASRGGIEGPWSDFYSLGATFYRCIFGEPPGNSRTRYNRLKETGQDPYQSAVIRGEGRYSDTLLEVLDWMLRLDWRRRPRSVGQIVNFLTHQIGGESGQPDQIPARSKKILLAGSRDLDLQKTLANLSGGAILGGVGKHGPLGLASTRVRDERWHLFRLPPAPNFRVVWPALSVAASGALLLINDAQTDPIGELRQMMRELWGIAPRLPLAIGVCNTEGSSEQSLARYWELLRSVEEGFEISAPLFTLAQSNPEHLGVLQEGLYTVLNPVTAA